ncbi:MAG: DNA-binding response regulator [Bacteroidetes bacterium HGW-Bacteroidetes-2]|jgi:DNA-binding NarL/FixJ family response regulator|nr:MAG: DNA-binding response regulator [Bacteroidetes bacterium HGW-Bacteroidetes-2]
MKNSSILIADDHPLLLKGLNDFLVEKRYNIIGKAVNGKDAFEFILSEKPDIAILDIQMPLLSGIEIASLCLKNKIKTKIILITFHKEASVYFQAQELQVYGYLLKEFAIEEIESCIDSVLNNIPYFSKKIREHLHLNTPKNENLKLLTPSERKILTHIVQDNTNKEIAELLFISSRTVEKHRSNIINKLKLERKTNSLLLWAMENKDILEI